MREKQHPRAAWEKYPQIPAEARKPLENVFRRKFDIDDEILDDQIEVFVEAYDRCVSSGGLIDQFKNHIKSGVIGYEKALRRRVRLVRFVHNTISALKLNPSHIDWQVVWAEYNKAHPKGQYKSAAGIKATYHRALADIRVKAHLFDKEYSEYGEVVKKIILHQENPEVAQQTIRAALYDVAMEYGEFSLSGTVIVTGVRMGLPLDEQSVVSFSDTSTTYPKVKEAHREGSHHQTI